MMISGVNVMKMMWLLRLNLSTDADGLSFVVDIAFDAASSSLNDSREGAPLRKNNLEKLKFIFLCQTSLTEEEAVVMRLQSQLHQHNSYTQKRRELSGRQAHAAESVL